MAVDRSARGSVLAPILLLLLALQILAHGALLLARREAAASAAGARLLQARVGAESALGMALASEPPLFLAIPTGAPGALVWGAAGAHPFRAAARRLTRETWVVWGWGGHREASWGLATGGPVWILDPAARVVAQRATVVLAGGGSSAPGGTVAGGRIDEETEPLPGPACGPWSAVLDTLGPTGSVDAVGRELPGPGEPHGLGALGVGGLVALLPRLSWQEGTPGPSWAFGACDTADPLNLGDPGGPPGPCGDHLPARGRDGDLVLRGGVGQGLLVVDGSLALAGARWDGVVVTSGDLVLREGARLLGWARVGGGLDVDASSRIGLSGCRAFRALVRAAPHLARPLPLSPPSPLEPPPPWPAPPRPR